MPTCTLDQVRRYVGNGVRMLMVRAVPDGEKNPKFEETFAEFKNITGSIVWIIQSHIRISCIF